MENKIIYSEIPDNLREQSENLKKPVDIAHMIFFPVVPFLLSVDQWLEIPREDLYFYKARYFVFSLILSLLPVLVGFLYARRKARKRQEKICRCMERAQQEDCILTFSEEGICLFSKKTGEAKDIPYEGVKEILEERDAFHILLDRGEKTFLKKYFIWFNSKIFRTANLACLPIFLSRRCTGMRWERRKKSPLTA